LPDVKNFAGARIFHPAFPNFVTESVSLQDANALATTKHLLSSSDIRPNYAGLPWKVFPSIGISDEQHLWSKSQICDAYEKNKYQGFLVWAHKIDKPEKGCILLNHWSQKAILLTDYDVDIGAKGYEVKSNTGAVNFFNWPPLALELEMTEKTSRWQAVRVSENIASGEVYSSLPSMMAKAPWELIFLLLLSKEQHAETLQALFDTGLCPRQGLIAYIRLLEQVQYRAESWEDIPKHRKITEDEVVL